MAKRGSEPIVRHAYAPDPNPEKVAAALELWRKALAGKMVQQPAQPGPVDGEEAEG